MAELKTLVDVLESANYKIVSRKDLYNQIVFESDTVIGLAIFWDDCASLITEWQKREAQILKRYAHDLRGAGQKAWNVYSVLLSRAPWDDATQQRMLRIEEDFSGTRKIARAGVTSRKSVVSALLPLMPLQFDVALEYRDPDAELRVRLNLPDAVADLVMAGADAEAVVSWLVGEWA